MTSPTSWQLSWAHAGCGSVPGACPGRIRHRGSSPAYNVGQHCPQCSVGASPHLPQATQGCGTPQGMLAQPAQGWSASCGATPASPFSSGASSRDSAMARRQRRRAALASSGVTLAEGRQGALPRALGSPSITAAIPFACWVMVAVAAVGARLPAAVAAAVAVAVAVTVALPSPRRCGPCPGPGARGP